MRCDGDEERECGKKEWRGTWTYTLSNISETGDDSDLSGEHDVGSSLDTIDERLSTTVQVVELGLGDLKGEIEISRRSNSTEARRLTSVVDVDGGDLELAILEGSVEVVDTGGSLLRNSLDS